MRTMTIQNKSAELAQQENDMLCYSSWSMFHGNVKGQKETHHTLCRCFDWTCFRLLFASSIPWNREENVCFGFMHRLTADFSGKLTGHVRASFTKCYMGSFGAQTQATSNIRLEFRAKQNRFSMTAGRNIMHSSEILFVLGILRHIVYRHL
jgi:hypothetical protein